MYVVDGQSTYSPTLLRIPVNLLPWVLYWEFHLCFVLKQTAGKRVQCDSGEEKSLKTRQIAWNSSPTSSAHHLLVDVDVNCRKKRTHRKTALSAPASPPRLFASTSLERVVFA